MALSGKGSVGSFGPSGAFQVWYEWTASQHISGNYSDVTAKLYVKSIYAGSWFSSNSTAAIDINGTANNVNISATVNAGQTVCVHTSKVRVTHGSDGAKSFTINAWFNANINSWGQCWSRGSFTLNKIPRAYDFIISSDNITMGSPLNIKITDNGSGLSAKVYISYGKQYKFMKDNATIGTTFSVTPSPDDFGPQIPNATTGVGSIIVDTYSGGTKIGSTSKALRLNIPADAKPTVASVTYADTATAVTAVTGSNQYLLQGLSSPKVTASATSVYGATVTSYKFEFNNKAFSVPQNNYTISLGVNPNMTGSQTVTVTATDSRGRTASKTVALNILAYAQPTISNFSVSRDTTTATTIKVTKTVAVSAIKPGTTELNPYTVVTKIRGSGETNWTTVKTENSTSTNLTLTGYAVTSSFDVSVTVTDKLNTVTVTSSVSTASVLVDFYKDEGVGIGKMYEPGHGALDIGDDVWVNGRSLLNTFYPIGTIYESTASTNPSSFMGGTWERFGNGKVLIGVDETDTDFATPSKTGGSKTNTHNHSKNGDGGTISTVANSSGGYVVGSKNSVSSTTISVLDPYITVYRWRRTA